ncbi:hypothetical protein B566_EDAN004309 [Ephemera danica]|nr:hypothetical protein B566_EDAN004309 [Ephemera danica]
MVLSTLAQYDDLIRLAYVLSDGAEPEFLKFVKNQEQCRQKWLQAEEECRRLQAKLTESNHALSEMESKLEHARNLLDQEKRQRRTVEQERDALEKQISLVRDMLENNKVNDETREKLAFLNNSRNLRYSEARGGGNLERINELESTGSILSELGYSQSEDELEVSFLRSGRPRRRSSRPKLPEEMDFITPKRRRSSRPQKESLELEVVSGHRVVATTTLTVNHQGPVTASAKLQAVGPKPGPSQPPPTPSAPPMPLESDGSSEDSFWQRAGNKGGLVGPAGDVMQPQMSLPPATLNRNYNARNHVFCTKNIIRPESCGPCGRKIKFAAKVMKCVDCRALSLADFTPMVPPMVPALVVHCIQEVERRGSSVVGLYRIPGAESEVKALRERFMKGRGAPDLSGTDLAVVCGAFKEFLRSLSEPLVPTSQWTDFVRASEHKDLDARRASLYTCIAELPRPNRDTLAFVITHLQRVGSWEECKMPLTNLAKAMRELLDIPADYWSNFLNREVSVPVIGAELRGTPSSSSLHHRESTQRPGFFTATPRSARLLLGKKDKFFSTPQ